MKLLVVGATGMLGQDLASEARARGIDTLGVGSKDCDVRSQLACARTIIQHQPNVVINCAAYTDVDGAESEVEQAIAINALGAKNIAESCWYVGAKCIYVSTDYVFDGLKGEPYLESDWANPVSMYGKSKLAGELNTLSNCDKGAVVRTSWLFGLHGKNFITSVINKATQQNTLRVTDDQLGCPTYTRDLAKALLDVGFSDSKGIFHATNQGWCSKYQFTQEVFGLLGWELNRIVPITSAEYPLPAKRPPDSRLSNQRFEQVGLSLLPDWKDALCRFLDEKQMLT